MALCLKGTGGPIGLPVIVECRRGTALPRTSDGTSGQIRLDDQFTLRGIGQHERRPVAGADQDIQDIRGVGHPLGSPPGCDQGVRHMGGQFSLCSPQFQLGEKVCLGGGQCSVLNRFLNCLLLVFVGIQVPGPYRVQPNAAFLIPSLEGMDVPALVQHAERPQLVAMVDGLPTTM